MCTMILNKTKLVELFPSLVWVMRLLKEDLRLKYLEKKFDGLLEEIIMEWEMQGRREKVGDIDFIDLIFTNIVGDYAFFKDDLKRPSPLYVDDMDYCCVPKS